MKNISDRRLTPDEIKLYRLIPLHVDAIRKSKETLGIDLHDHRECNICSNEYIGHLVRKKLETSIKNKPCIPDFHSSSSKNISERID